jgi:hypothetical protein
VLDACAAAGKAAGLHVVIPERDAVARAVEDGFTFLALGVDSVFLRRGAAEALAGMGIKDVAGSFISGKGMENEPNPKQNAPATLNDQQGDIVL